MQLQRGKFINLRNNDITQICLGLKEFRYIKILQRQQKFPGDMQIWFT